MHDIVRTALCSIPLLALAAPAHAAFVVSQDENSNVICSSGTCTPTAADAVLNVKRLHRMLRQGNVTLASGSAAQDIVVSAELSWTSPKRLTLDAWRAIRVTKPVTSQGSGGVTLTVNDGGTGGDYTFEGQGRIAFWDPGASLIIDGQSYTLANDIASLAAHIAAHPDGHHALAANYDASVDGAYAASPVSTEFTGVFEGLGHKIANLEVDVPLKHKYRFAGLFFKARSGAVLRDIGMTGFRGMTVTGRNKGYVDLDGFAPLVGDLENASVRYSYATESYLYLDHYDSGGGLVGYAKNAAIEHSHADVTIDGLRGMQGGLVSQLVDGTIDDSYATGTLSGRGYLGGLVSLASGTLRNCHAAVTLLDDGGGLVQAMVGGRIESCFATGDIHSRTGNMGGLVVGNAAAIVNSYATGSIFSNYPFFVGGLVAGQEATGTITSSYAIGHVPTGTSSTSGGVIGQDFNGPAGRRKPPGTNASVYWDLETSGISDPSQGAGNIADDPGLTGLTTAQFTSGLPDGFDPAVWGQSAGINNGYPYLIANPPP